MLGALLGLLVITFIGWFISIFKKFNNFIKEGSDFTTTQLVCLLISNFLVVCCGVMLIGTIIGSIIEEVNRTHTAQSASLIVIIPLIVGIILSSYGDYCIYKTYSKQQKKRNKNFETTSCLDCNVMNLSKWRTLSFEKKVNIVLLSIAVVSCVISIAGFGYHCSYSYRDNGFLAQWLIASFISAIFIGIWYYLNFQRFTIEQCKKYGIIFIVAGFLSLISPFIAIAFLTEGTIMLKKVFNKQYFNSTLEQKGHSDLAPLDNFDINSLQLWIDECLKDFQSLHLKTMLSPQQQKEVVIYVISLLYDDKNKHTKEIIDYISSHYNFNDNLLVQAIKNYKYYRNLLSNDVLGYTSLIICKLCVYPQDTPLEQILNYGKESNLKKILEKYPQHEVFTNNFMIYDEKSKQSDDVSYIYKQLSIDLTDFERQSITMAYSLEILQ